MMRPGTEAALVVVSQHENENDVNRRNTHLIMAMRYMESAGVKSADKANVDM